MGSLHGELRDILRGDVACTRCGSTRIGVKGFWGVWYKWLCCFARGPCTRNLTRGPCTRSLYGELARGARHCLARGGLGTALHRDLAPPCARTSRLLARGPCTALHKGVLHCIVQESCTRTLHCLAWGPCTTLHEDLARGPCAALHGGLARGPCTGVLADFPRGPCTALHEGLARGLSVP